MYDYDYEDTVAFMEQKYIEDKIIEKMNGE